MRFLMQAPLPPPPDAQAAPPPRMQAIPTHSGVLVRVFCLGSFFSLQCGEMDSEGTRESRTAGVESQ